MAKDPGQQPEDASVGPLTNITRKLGDVIVSADNNAKSLGEQFTDGFKSNYENLQKNANLLSNTKDALGKDLGKFQLAFAPLTQIPGVETAITILKGVGAKILLYLIRKFKWEKSEEARKKIGDRAKNLMGKIKGDKGKDGKLDKQKKSGWRLMFVGLTTAIAVFVKGFVGGFQQGLSKVLKFVGLEKWANLLKDKSAKNLKSMGGKITGFTNKLKAFFKPFDKVIKVIQPAIKFIGKALQWIGKIGKFLGRLFWPINILFAAIEGLKGGYAGFQKYEGDGIVNQIMGGLLGFIGGVVSFLVGWPLDLLKSAVTWIGEKMGFDMTVLEEFSFQDMFKTLWTDMYDYILGGIQYVKDVWNSIDIGAYLGGLVDRAMNFIKLTGQRLLAFPKAVIAGGKAAVFNLLGDPLAAFNEAFAKSMEGSEAEIATTVAKGEELQAQSDKTTEAARDVEFRYHGEKDTPTNNVVSTNNVQNNQTTKKSIPTRQIPVDAHAHRLALAQ